MGNRKSRSVIGRLVTVAAASAFVVSCGVWAWSSLPPEINHFSVTKGPGRRINLVYRFDARKHAATDSHFRQAVRLRVEGMNSRLR